MFAGLALAAPAETLPVKRVVLSSSGMAKIDREGAVDGNAEISLPVALDQVDDILKSLTIFDSKGKIDSVRLAGKEPLAQAFRLLPFGAADLDSPEALLAALRGAEVSVAGPRVIRGRIVNVTPISEKIGEAGVITRHRLTILGSDGLQSVTIEDAQQITFADPAMQAKLDRALSASLESRAKDERSVTVSLTGQGSRNVALSYVVPAPIWKTAYRLMLPKDGAKALLQGWAVLENMTGSDWDKIDLSIVSGNPATFHQPLYESYYVKRPDMPVQVYGRVTPRADEGELDAAKATSRGMFAPVPAMPAPPLQNIVVTAERKAAMGAQAAESAETGAQIAFRFPQPVSVAAGQSLTAPFIGREFPVERVWLYQPDANPIHPLTAIRIANDGDAGLPAGILTVFEGDHQDYAGDAAMPNLPRSDSRIVSYALDQKTLIERREDSDRLLASLTAERGVIHVVRRVIADTTYTIKAPADDSRTIILEQPKRPDFEPDDAKNLEVTPTHYRLKTMVAARETKEVRLRLVEPVREDVNIASLDPAAVDVWIGSAREIGNRAAVDALGDIARQRRAVADADSRIADIDGHVQRIGEDQERLRLNLAQTPKDSDIAKRYLDTLSAQETELAGLARARAAAEQDQAAAKTKLTDMIASAKF
jgi:hypothetical protein